MKITCAEYQIIAEQAPNIHPDDLRAALNHLTDCRECCDRKTAYKTIKGKSPCKS